MEREMKTGFCAPRGGVVELGSSTTIPFSGGHPPKNGMEIENLKIVVVNGVQPPYRDKDGISYVSLLDFMSHPDILKLD